MNVKELREMLANYADEAVVAVACESRCDPHPIESLSGGKRLLMLYQDERIDIDQRTGKERKSSW